jgi:hypothetical protein
MSSPETEPVTEPEAPSTGCGILGRYPILSVVCCELTASPAAAQPCFGMDFPLFLSFSLTFLSYLVSFHSRLLWCRLGNRSLCLGTR